MLHRRCHSTAESHAVERCSESHRSLRHPQRRRTRIQGPPRSSNSSMCRRRAFSRRSQSSSRRRSSTTSSRRSTTSILLKISTPHLAAYPKTSSYSFKRTFMIVWYALMTASPTATKTSFHNSWRTRTTSTKKPVFRAALPTGSSSSPGQGTPGAGDISSMPRPLVRSLLTSILIHLILILLMRRIQPLLQLCLV